MPMLGLDTLAVIIGIVVTLFIFSYLIGDNILYRWALAILVGSSVGYALGAVGWYVYHHWIIPALKSDALGKNIFYAVPLLLGVFLLLKGTSSKLLGRFAVLGNIAMAYLIGVGAAVAISGVVIGTLIPQARISGEALTLDNLPWGLLRGILIVVGTVTSLLVFSPRAYAKANSKINTIMQGLQRIGRLFVTVALAVAFSGALTAALTTLVIRVWQIVEFALSFLGG